MVAFKFTTFAAFVLTAVSLASAASLPVSKRQDAPKLNPFGALSLNDIPQRCRDTCDDVTELANNAQCLSNLACVCNDGDDDIGECFSCVVRHTADEQGRTQILGIGRGVLSEYHQICNNAGHPVPEGTLADDGRYSDNDGDSGDDWDDNNSDGDDDQWDDQNESGNESGHDDNDPKDDDGDGNDGGSDVGDDDLNDIDGDDSDDEDGLHTDTGGSASNTGGHGSDDQWDDGNDSGDESDDGDDLNRNGGSNTNTGENTNADRTTNALNANDAGATGAASGLRIPAAGSLVGAFALGALAL